MKFLVNPECYHKMCQSCVDRIFSLGPAPCPYPDCKKTLRKNKFTKQIFEDLGVEREVNVRQRVGKTFNKREQDFETLEEYNDYLEEVENIVFNLVNAVDVEETETKLQAYEQANRVQILQISQRQKHEDEQLEELQQLEKERKRQAYLLALEEEKEEQEMKQQAERDIIRQLATSQGEAKEIMKKASEMALKRSQNQKNLLKVRFSAKSLSLKSRSKSKAKFEVPGNATPFTPFNGDRQLNYLFNVQDDYFDPLMDDVRNELSYAAAGFSVPNAQKQALVQAFFGLGCNIELEKGHQKESIAT